MQVYFDNAATTPLDREVFEAMSPYMLDHYGNPSSVHSHGRKVRSAIERSRKKVADLLNVSASEIFFTSGGTEADNTAIKCCVETYDIHHVISAKIEHHAVLHTIEKLQQEGKIQLSYVNLDEKGNLDLDHLQQLLTGKGPSMVSLMHANNELGNINDIEKIGEFCKAHRAIFHSDTVQTVGHYPLNLKDFNVNFIAGAAHKFHGPKGAGFLYIKNDHKISPFIYGGAQERNMRGGTENVYGIVGLAKALEIACERMEDHRAHIRGLKDHMINRLKELIPSVEFNGNSAISDKSLYTVLNVSLPPHKDSDMLLFNLDLTGVSASGGSACSSGSSLGSHVLAAIKADSTRGAVRFSFSKYNTLQEVDYVAEKLAEIYAIKVKG